jgi:hypothetical protein
MHVFSARLKIPLLFFANTLWNLQFLGFFGLEDFVKKDFIPRKEEEEDDQHKLNLCLSRSASASQRCSLLQFELLPRLRERERERERERTVNCVITVDEFCRD